MEDQIKQNFGNSLKPAEIQSRSCSGILLAEYIAAWYSKNLPPRYPYAAHKTPELFFDFLYGQWKNEEHCEKLLVMSNWLLSSLNTEISNFQKTYLLEKLGSVFLYEFLHIKS
jgi:hypothetical protein